MRHRFRRLFTVPLLVLALGGVPACTHTPPDLSASTVAVVRAADVLQRVGELQTVTISANRQGLVSDKDAVTTVKFTTAATRTLMEIPAGWSATVTTSYLEFRRLHLPLPPVIAAVLTILDSMLGVRP